MSSKIVVFASALTIAAATVLLVACGSDGNGTTSPNGNVLPDTRAPLGAVSCGATKAVFTQPPVALSDIIGWVPLGNMGPPGHTFPTDHQYLYVSDPNTQVGRREVNIVAPADIIITKAHLGTTTPGIADYSVEFSPCAEVYAQFGHVSTIAPAILSRLGAFDQYCNTYSPAPGASVSTCETKAGAIKVSAGEIIGTAGGASPHSLALDFSLWDARVPAIAYVNPARWSQSNDRFDNLHVVGASDYFAEPVKSQLAARVGSYDGATHRTVLPIGGSIAVDVAGSMMGFWFNPTQPTYPEVPHLAVSPDNLDPTRVAFSVGTSLPGWNRGIVWFTPVNAGYVNRNPAQVSADGSIYCFESAGPWVILAKLVDANTLRLEAEPQAAFSCAAAQPWTFTAAAFDYKR
jgi:hypothetical protein